MEKRLPNVYAIFGSDVEFVAFLDVESFVPSRDLGKCSVHTPTSGRVGVGLDEIAEGFITCVAGPHEGVADEEALLGSEGGLLHCVLESLEGHFQTAVVGNVFSAGECAIGMKAGQHLDFVEEFHHSFGAGFEVLLVLLRPPVTEVAVLVKLCTLVVKAVRHLVTNHHTDSTIVGSIVGLSVEEGGLKNAGGEANFVGRGVVVGIDGLRCHAPFVDVHGLIDTLLNVVVRVEHRGPGEVLVVREIFIDVQPIVAAPLVGITDFHVETVELFVGLFLGFGAHPSLLVDAFAEGHLQVLDQFEHTLLGRLREVLFCINPTHLPQRPQRASSGGGLAHCPASYGQRS